MNQRPQGFTLIEILLVIAAIALIGGFASVSVQLQNRNDLAITVNTLAHDLRRAQLLAQAADGDVNGDSNAGSWGVHIASGALTLFKGASFAARDPNFDEVSTISSSIAASGPAEVIFAKFSGLPVQQGAATVTFTTNANETHAITISPKGTLDY